MTCGYAFFVGAWNNGKRPGYKSRLALRQPLLVKKRFYPSENH